MPFTSCHAQAIKKGGRKEYESVKAITSKPKTPQMGIAGMRAMGASQDKTLQGKSHHRSVDDMGLLAVQRRPGNTL